MKKISSVYIVLYIYCIWGAILSKNLYDTPPSTLPYPDTL